VRKGLNRIKRFIEKPDTRYLDELDGEEAKNMPRNCTAYNE